MRSWRVLACIGAAAAAWPDLLAGQDSVTAFVHVAVVPMDREQVLPDQTVIVQGGRITALGPARRIPVPAGASRIAGQGKYLLPGLADMHAHLGQLDTIDIADVLVAYLANGVTTLREMHGGSRRQLSYQQFAGDGPWHLRLRQRVAAGELLGPRLYLAGDPDHSSPAAAAQSVAELKADGYDFVKLSLDQRWPDQAKPLYDSIIAVAKRVGLRPVGHVSSRLPLVQVFADRWASTEHLYGYREYMLGLGDRESFTDNGSVYGNKPIYADTAFWMRPGYQLAPAKLRELAQAARRAGVWTCPTLIINQIVYDNLRALPPAQQQQLQKSVSLEVYARGLAFEQQIVQALQAGGAGLLLGTDATEGLGPIGFTVHEELKLLVRAGLTPYEALATGTRNVAQFLGTLDSTGTVAVGKRADLVLLRGNPLTDISYTAGPAGVMVRGQWFDRAELDRRLDAMVRDGGASFPKLAESEKRFFYDALRTARQTHWHH